MLSPKGNEVLCIYSAVVVRLICSLHTVRIPQGEETVGLHTILFGFSLCFS